VCAGVSHSLGPGSTASTLLTSTHILSNFIKTKRDNSLFNTVHKQHQQHSPTTPLLHVIAKMNTSTLKNSSPAPSTAQAKGSDDKSTLEDVVVVEDRTTTIKLVATAKDDESKPPSKQIKDNKNKTRVLVTLKKTDDVTGKFYLSIQQCLRFVCIWVVVRSFSSSPSSSP
jgi:hypothetical protein